MQMLSTGKKFVMYFSSIQNLKIHLLIFRINIQKTLKCTGVARLSPGGRQERNIP